MTAQTYLMVNQATNICDNTVVWDGDTSTWTPPSDHIAVPQATTPAMVWVLNADKTAFVLGEQIGAGQIGFTWDGTRLTTNEPQPEPPKAQPEVSGAQTL